MLSSPITNFQKITLGISGITALGIGGFILVAPHAFYASYGIALGTDPSLLSEVRAPATNLAVLGVLILAGIVRPAWAQVSTVIALTVFLAFPAGRFVSLILDGVPSGSILGALIIEVAIGALCLAAFWRRPFRNISKNTNLEFHS